MRSLLAVVVLLATAACDGSPPAPTPPPAVTPQPDTAAAPVARIAVAVDDLGSRDAIVALSEVAVDAKASTGSGDLTYTVDFGDGTTTTDPVARHVYHAPGTFTITCLVRDPAGRTATASRQIVVKTLTGRWFHAGYVPRARRVEVRSLTITDQEGVTIRGFYGVTSTPDRPFTGRLASPRDVHIAIDDQSVQLDGVVPGSLNDDLPWTLQMHGAAVDGQRLAFRSILGEPVGPGPDAVFRIRFDSFGAARPIQGLSPIRFDGSTSRGDGLSYVIEFGDGEVSTEPAVSHRIDTSTMNPSGFLLSGLVTARMTVVDRFGRTDAESNSFFPFEVADCGCGTGWVFAEGNTFRRFGFGTRQGLNLTGSLRWRDPGSGPDGATTPFVARLSGERDIHIVLQGSGIEFRGHIELGPSESLTQMILTQTGGPDHGRVWTLRYDGGH